MQAEEGTFIGSDTCLTSADRKLAANYSKWFCYRSWGIGFAGTWRVANIIELNKNRVLTGVKYPEDFVNKLIKLFDEHDTGIASPEDFVKNYGQNMLLCRKNAAVYHIDPLLAVSEIPFNVLWAEGSGSDFAVGCGYGTIDKSPEERVRLAVAAAIEYSTSCGGSIFVKKL